MPDATFIRFFLVSLAGVLIDIGLALGLNVLAGIPLRPAAVISFAVAACFNYVLHEKWSFGGRESPLSGKRLVAFVTVSVTVLGVRLVVLTVLAMLLPAEHFWNLIALVTAVGFSYLINYGVSRWVIFVRGGLSRRP